MSIVKSTGRTLCLPRAQHAAAMLFLACALTVPARASVPTMEEAALVARNWLALSSAQGAKGYTAESKISGDWTITQDATVLAYVFAIEPAGFVVVPGLKELAAVRACSGEFNLDRSGRDDFTRMVTADLKAQMGRFATRNGSVSATAADGSAPVHPSWNALGTREISPAQVLATDPEFILSERGPLLTTSWSQGAPYNAQCPEGAAGRSLVGCVATATAQILRYHRYPTTGTGTHSYFWDGDEWCGGETTPGRDLDATYTDAYDWANMPDIATTGSSTVEQEAVAELCYEVGVALEMTYSSCSTGSQIENAVTALPQHFRYDPSIESVERSAFDQASWFAAIRAEIDANRPVLYRIGLGAGRGHAVVCDGWRQLTGIMQYHINFGEGGPFTSWYSVDQIHLSDDPLNSERMVRNIQPQSNVIPAMTMTQDTHWYAGDPYLLTGNVTVASGVTLTIDPGAVIKFAYQSDTELKQRLVVNGRLVAQGDAAAPIVFTSARDDSCGGDTNGDGSDTSPGTGDWGYVQLNGSGSRLEHCILRYGGYRDDDSASIEVWHNYMLWIRHLNTQVVDCDLEYVHETAIYADNGSSPTISGNRIGMVGLTTDNGIYCNGAAPVITGNTINHAIGYAIYCTGTSPTVEDNVVLAGGLHGIRCTGATPTVARNQVTDAAYGILCGSGTGTVVDNVVSRGTYALWFDGGRPDVHGNQVNGSVYRLGLYNGTWLDYAANTYQDIQRPAVLVGGTISQSCRWPVLPGDPVSYLLVDNLTVDPGDTLTLDPGVVVKFGHQSDTELKRRIVVNGRLDAVGTAAQPIVLTSERDDTYGADTGADGGDTSPAAGDWGYVQFNGSGSRLEHCILRYGGYRDDDSANVYLWHNYMLWIRHLNTQVIDCDLEHVYETAIYADNGSSPTISGNRIGLVGLTTDNGIYCNGATPVITGNTINHAIGYAIYCTGSSPTVEDNVVLDGGLHGIRCTGATPTVARNQVTDAAYGILCGSGTGTVVDNVVSRGTYALWFDGGRPDVRGNQVNGSVYRLGLYNGSWLDYAANTYHNIQRPAVLVGGTISQSCRWPVLPGDPVSYLLVDNLTVDPGDTLTLDPGVVVKFSYQSDTELKRRIVVNGRIDAAGTATQPIVLTSERDDAYGTDTGADGGDTSPAAGDWGYVQLNGSGSRLEHCVLRYGGYRDDESANVYLWHNYMLWIRHLNTSVASCTIAGAHTYAIYCDGVSPDLHGNTISAPQYGIYVAVSPTTPWVTTIANNEIQITGAAGYGVWFDGHPSNSVLHFTENVITGPSAGDGVYLKEIAAGSTVSSNTIENHSRGLVLSASNAFVGENTINQTGGFRGAGCGIEAGTGVVTSIMANRILGHGVGVRAITAAGAVPANLGIYGNQIVDNATGIQVESASSATVDGPAVIANHNDFHGNSSYNFYVGPYRTGQTLVLDATQNWWGSADSTAVAATIRDRLDGFATVPLVNFTPFRDGPTGDDEAAIYGYPGGLTFELMPGGARQGTLTLGNRGTSALNFSISTSVPLPATPEGTKHGPEPVLGVATVVPWLTVTPAIGTIAPGDRLAVTVAVAAGTMPDGEYLAYLVIASDDPAVDVITAPITVHVGHVFLSPPDGLAAGSVVPGDRVTLAWATYHPEEVDQVTVQLSTDDGVTWSHDLYAGGSQPQTFDWTVGITPSEVCRLRVVVEYADGSSYSQANRVVLRNHSCRLRRNPCERIPAPLPSRPELPEPVSTPARRSDSPSPHALRHQFSCLMSAAVCAARCWWARWSKGGMRSRGTDWTMQAIAARLVCTYAS
jgi:hypothetical protein